MNVWKNLLVDSLIKWKEFVVMKLQILKKVVTLWMGSLKLVSMLLNVGTSISMKDFV